MSALGNGTTQYVRAAATVTAPVSYTYMFWYLPPNAPNTTDTRQPVGIRNDAGTAGRFDITFVWDYPDAAIYKGATHREAGGSYIRCQLQGSVPSAVWIHIAVTYTTGSPGSLKVYLNGILNNTVSANAPHTDAPLIAICAYSNLIGFDDAHVAEFCFWNVALTATEIESIVVGGATPSSVQNAAVISYFPANADSDETIGPNMVNSGCTFRQTIFVGMTGGLGIGGPTSTIHMVQSTGGGLAVGGADLGITYTFTMIGGLAIGGSMDTFLQLGNGAFVMVNDRGLAQTENIR